MNTFHTPTWLKREVLRVSVPPDAEATVAALSDADLEAVSDALAKAYCERHGDEDEDEDDY